MNQLKKWTVKELEKKISDMKEDHESSLMSQQKDDEDKTKMAEKDDDEKKSTKMSETLTESTLLSEVVALRESNAQLSERLETIENEKREIEKREAVNVLLRDGKITPKESDVVGKAYLLRELQPEFWQMFSERPANSAVPLETVGHGASGQEINRNTLHESIKTLAAEKGVTYSEALDQFRIQNPDYYNKAFGA